MLDDIGQRHDKSVTVGLEDALHPDNYRGDSALALECRTWLQNTPNPSLTRVLLMGFILNRGLVFMACPHAGSEEAEATLIESKHMLSIMKDRQEPDELALEEDALEAGLEEDARDEPEHEEQHEEQHNKLAALAADALGAPGAPAVPSPWPLVVGTEQEDAELSAFEKELHALSL